MVLYIGIIVLLGRPRSKPTYGGGTRKHLLRQDSQKTQWNRPEACKRNQGAASRVCHTRMKRRGGHRLGLDVPKQPCLPLRAVARRREAPQPTKLVLRHIGGVNDCQCPLATKSHRFAFVTQDRAGILSNRRREGESAPAPHAYALQHSSRCLRIRALVRWTGARGACVALAGAQTLPVGQVSLETPPCQTTAMNHAHWVQHVL